MEWLFIIALIVGGLWLKARLDGAVRHGQVLEHEIATLRDRLDELIAREPFAAPARRTISVPQVRIERAPVATADPQPEPAEVEARPAPAPPDPQAASPEDVPPVEAAEAEKAPDPAAAEPAFRFDFEDIFGRRLPIWAGGVTLAVTGVFLVSYSIEQGLLTESVRVMLAFLFGLLLVAAGEVAHRNPARIGDPRIRQALAGAGLATLYAAFYLAGTQYGLMAQGVAFLGLAGVTAAAIALSFRFGLPAAVLGLVGGFAAPALVASTDPNLPLLALYLALVVAGLAWTGHRQRRAWLGLAALSGGLGWGALMLLTEDPGSGDIVAMGLYFALVGAVVPALSEYGVLARWVRIGGAALASLQLAVLVERSLHDPLAWALYLLLGIALAVLGWTRRPVREASGFAAAVAVMLLAWWDLPYPPLFTLVAAGFAAVFAGLPLMHLARTSEARIDLWLVAAVPLGIGLAAIGQFAQWSGDPVQFRLALGMAALAALPALGALLLHRRGTDGPSAHALPLPVASTGLLAWFALLLTTPGWVAPVAIVPVLLATLIVLRTNTGRAAVALRWALVILAGLALLVTADFFPESRRLVGLSSDADVPRAVLRWGALGLAAAALAFFLPRDGSRLSERRAAAALAASFGYGALAQFVPAQWLAPTLAGLAVASRHALPRWPAASVTLIAIALCWALVPLGLWGEAVLRSLSGYPVLVDALPPASQALLRLLVPAAALAVLAPALARADDRSLPGLRALAAGLGLVALHILFKQLFAIDTLTRFQALGTAERTVWQGLLVGAGWATWQLAEHRPWGRALATGFAAAGLGHYALYSIGLNNPLWSEQAVGPTPIANLVLAAAAIAIAAIVLLRRLAHARLAPVAAGVADWATMLVSAVAAIALLRQAFAGTILTATPLGPNEDLLRSLIGILIALAFLAIGARRGERSWRIGSLAVMLVAVVKVFVFDAAGLEGLVRIASFLALGLSLIAIGWFYARVLRSGDRSVDPNGEESDKPGALS